MAAFEINAKPSRIDNSFGMFYSSLRSHGDWIELDADVIAWRPYGVGRHWKPYTLGRWSWTSQGWYWDSYEPFGWATYHYGRWHYDDYYGWIWLPDYAWAPAWVEWRYDDDYIGWAPLPPYASFHPSFGIRFTFGWRSHYSFWNFVSYRRFCDHRVHYYVLDSRRSSRIFENTKYRNNYYSDRDRIVNGGVDRELVERRGGYRVAERNIRNTEDYNALDRKRSSRDNEVYAYRPSERVIRSDREAEKYEIKRGENRSSIDRDKMAISSGREVSRESINRKELERGAVNNERELIRDRKIDSDRSNNERNSESTEKRGTIERGRNIESDREIERRNYDSVKPVPRIDRDENNRVAPERSTPKVEREDRRSNPAPRIESNPSRESNSPRPSVERRGSSGNTERKSDSGGRSAERRR